MSEDDYRATDYDTYLRWLDQSRDVGDGYEDDPSQDYDY